MAQAQCSTLLPARRPFAPPQGCSGQWLGLRWRSAQATPLLRCAPPLGSLRRPHSPSPSELGSQSALHPPTPAPGRLLRCAPPPANPHRYRVIGLPPAPPVWYSSVRSNRSLRSPALCASHTGGSPSHPRVSHADAPPLPASASSPSLRWRSARGFGPFAALTLGTRGSANTTAHRSAHYAPLGGLHTVRSAHSRGQHKHRLEMQAGNTNTRRSGHECPRRTAADLRGASPAAEGSAWAASAGGVPPGLRPPPPGRCPAVYTLTPPSPLAPVAMLSTRSA